MNMPIQLLLSQSLRKNSLLLLSRQYLPLFAYLAQADVCSTTPPDGSPRARSRWTDSMTLT
ncbi:hypothetical protein M3J09_012437 [Ascochyta lentis]